MPLARSATLLLTAALLLAPGLSAQAQQRPDYRIEFILFENRDVPRDESERWRPEVTLPALYDAVTLARTADDAQAPAADDAAGEPDTREPDEVLRDRLLRPAPAGFRRLEDEERVLDREREALERSRRYRVLTHTGWQQPPLEHDQAVTVRVHAGDRFMLERSFPEGMEFHTFGIGIDLYAGQDPVIDVPAPLTDVLSATGADATGPDDAAGRGPLRQARTQRVETYALDGTVRLIISRYAHVHTDLYYTTRADVTEHMPEIVGETGMDPDDADSGQSRMAATAAAPDIARDMEGHPLLSYPIQLQRRMRSGELHYLDHPVVAMLVLVSRVEPDDDEPDPAE